MAQYISVPIAIYNPPADIGKDIGSCAVTPMWNPNQHQVFVMATLSFLSLMVALDACVVVTSLPAISVDINSNTMQTFWIGTAYLLSNAVMMPFIASLSNVFGRQVCLVVSLAFFTLGSLICCLAENITTLLIGRTFQGVGGGGIIVLSLLIFTDIVPLHCRPKWYGTVLAAWAIGNCSGPIIGGAIAEHTTWRWLFYIMLPFCAISLIAAIRVVTLVPKSATAQEKLKRVDWLGNLFFIISTAILLLAVSWGGTQYDWQSAATLIPLCLGVAGYVWTFFYEACIAKEPFLSRDLFRCTSSAAAYACGAIQGLVIYGQLYYVPFYFLAVKGYSPMHAGLALLPVMLTLVPSSIITGILVTRFQNYTYPIWIGWILTTTGSGLTILWDDTTHLAAWVIILVILGLGHGTVLNAQNFATQALCSTGLEGNAASMYAFLRQFGMALGVGVGSSVFQNSMSIKLIWEGLSPAIATQSEAFITNISILPEGSLFKEQVLDAYSYGFRGVYILFTAISGVGFLLSLFIKQVDMMKEIKTEHKLLTISNRI